MKDRIENNQEELGPEIFNTFNQVIDKIFAHGIPEDLKQILKEPSPESKGNITAGEFQFEVTRTLRPALTDYWKRVNVEYIGEITFRKIESASASNLTVAKIIILLSTTGKHNISWQAPKEMSEARYIHILNSAGYFPYPTEEVVKGRLQSFASNVVNASLKQES